MSASSSSSYRNPTPTVDILIELEDGIVLIERNNEPRGFAIPGGFVDEGESIEEAALREAKEETCLDVSLHTLLGVYSDPRRDPRQHTASTVYIATATGTLQAGDDAGSVCILKHDQPIPHMAFDHAVILQDYRHFRATGERPTPAQMLARRTRPLLTP